MRWTPGSEATSPWQQEEKGAHPASRGDLAHKSYMSQGAVIKQDQQVKVRDVFKCSSNENCARGRSCIYSA